MTHTNHPTSLARAETPPATNPAGTLPPSPAQTGPVPHLSQYFGTWAMHEVQFKAALAQVQRLDLAAHIAEHRAVRTQASDADRSRGYKIDPAGGTAVIELVGTLTKYGSSLVAGPALVDVRHSFRAALNDMDVRSILFLADSPGGTVAGTGDLADDIYRARGRKPIVTFIEDLGASGLYWIASQTDSIYASASAHVGSIGVFAVLDELLGELKGKGYSGALDLEGLARVNVVRRGAFKGAGVLGTPITPEQMAEFQRTVDADYELFTAAVARGRGWDASRATGVADGRIHVAQAALTLGLIDEISTFDAVVTGLATGGSAPADRTVRAVASDARGAAAGPEEEIAMSKPTTQAADPPPPDDETKPDEKKKAEDETKPDDPEPGTPPATDPPPAKKPDEEAASVAALEAALPNASAGFLLSCVKGGLTVSQARVMHQQAAADEPRKAPGTKGIGNAPQSATAGGDDAVDVPEFIARSRALAEKESISLDQARRRVAQSHPELYADYRDAKRSSPDQAGARRKRWQQR
jgi:signal peptide peptidase SppA